MPEPRSPETRLGQQKEALELPRGTLRSRKLILSAAMLAIALVAGMATAADWELRVCADPNRMPYSSLDMAGYDNIIAAVVAEELNAEVHFVWTSLNLLSVVLTDFLYTGECDVIFGMQDGEEGVLATAAYYRSPYAFVYRAEAGVEVASFDDPVLHNVRIGVQGSPAEAALRQRGIVRNVTNWAVMTNYDREDWLGEIVAAVAEEAIDVAVVWGPIAGYFAQRYPDSLVVVPVPSEIEPPFIYLTRPMTAVVRPGDESLRDALDLAFARRWEEIQAVLQEFGVPVGDLPRPIPTAEAPR